MDKWQAQEARIGNCTDDIQRPGWTQFSAATVEFSKISEPRTLYLQNEKDIVYKPLPLSPCNYSRDSQTC